MVENLLAKELQENAKEILDLVRNRWLKGKRPDGSIIGSYKDFGYELFKRQENPLAGGNVDLTLDGGLNEGLFIRQIRGSLFNIFSSDKKAILIAEKYGLDNYNITPEETEKVLKEAGYRIYKELFNFVFK